MIIGHDANSKAKAYVFCWFLLTAIVRTTPNQKSHKEAAIAVLVTTIPGQAALRQPRAHGVVNLSVRASERGNTLRDLRQSGSLKALFPRANGPDFQTVLINTAGGITGGDTFSVEARAEVDTRLTLTTQAAERAYRAQPGQIGNLQNRIVIEAGARVNWLPQETILFQGCALARSLRVDMQAGASFLMVEPLIFGRAAMGEILTEASFTDRIEIRRQGQIAYLDALTLQGNIAAQLARPHTAASAGAMVSLVYVAADAGAQVGSLRALLPETAGVSLIRDDLLVLRLLAPDSYLMRQALIPVLNRLTDDNLPRCWMT